MFVKIHHTFPAYRKLDILLFKVFEFLTKYVEKLAKKPASEYFNFFYFNLKSNKIDFNLCGSSSVI